MPMGMTYLYYARLGVVCRHISVGFLLFLFDLIGIARPPFVNKTTEVCAFFVPIPQNNNMLVNMRRKFSIL